MRWGTALLLSLLSTLGCGGGEDVIIKTADGVELTAEDIDRAPRALLPGGAVAMAALDAPQLFHSSVGARLLALTEARLPLPASAGFEPRRDLKQLYVGIYSFQGVDFAGVAVGDFDPEAIARAADAATVTPLGSPLVRVEYAGRVFYVSANLGFVVLTNHTVVFGNETGIRRALDRIEAGRVKNELAPEIEALMQQPGAPIAIGADLASNPLTGSVAQEHPALSGLKMVRAVGNFEEPGFNLAATLTYANPEKAARARDAVTETATTLVGAGAVLGVVFGTGQPIQRFEATVHEDSTQIVLALNPNAVENLLNQASTWLGIDATQTGTNGGGGGQ